MSKSIDELLKDLQSNKVEVKEEAAFELGGYDDPKVVSALMGVLKSQHEEVGVRAAAAESLGRLGKVEAFDALMECLKSGEYMVRSAAAYALGKLGDKRAADALFFLLKDSDHSVVSSAAHALAKLHDRRAVLPLIHIVETKRPRQQVAAVRVLGDLHDAQAVAPLVKLYKKISDPDLKHAIIRALDDISAPGCEDVLMEALDDSVSFVRRYAADALGNIKHKPAKDKLMQLAQSDTDGDVRNVAKQAADKL
ncbi:MAG TPA: HEAT repeat domain-containing protein [bacterium]|nr:HEAT repeat domain-containing protein [bacterium]